MPSDPLVPRFYVALNAALGVHSNPGDGSRNSSSSR